MKLRTLYFILVAMVVLPTFAVAQKDKTAPPLDPSPADIAYFRPGGRNSEAVARVIYGRPSKKGRTMLGETEPFGKVWRLGANEATEIKLFKDVTFGDKLIKAGTYTMYAIPEKSEWTIIFNTKLDTWGAYSYEESKDVARIKVPVTAAPSEVEAFTIWFNDEVADKTMNIAWENTLVKVPVKI
jgi:hypothetical protein